MAMQLCACGDAQKSGQQEPGTSNVAQDVVSETDNVSGDGDEDPFTAPPVTPST